MRHLTPGVVAVIACVLPTAGSAATWGKEANGLRTRLVLSHTRIEAGRSIYACVDVQNVSKEKVDVAWVGALTRLLKVTRNAKDVTLKDLRDLPKSESQYVLEPGKQHNMLYAALHVDFDMSKPGNYTVQWPHVPWEFATKGCVPPPSKAVTLTVVAAKPKPKLKWLDGHKWSKPNAGLVSRLTAPARRFAAGKPIQMRIEMKNAGENARSYYGTSGYWPGDVTVVGPDGKTLPWLAPPVSTRARGPVIEPGRKALLDEFDLASYYYLRKPGKYAVYYNGCRAFEDEYTPVPKSPPFEIEVVADPAAKADGDPVGLLLAGLPKDWKVCGPSSPGSRLIHPGADWGRVRGGSLRLIHKSFRYKTPPERAGVHPITLWLTRERAEAESWQAATSMWQPQLLKTTYVGGNRFCHAYVHVPPNARQAWPAVLADLRKILGLAKPDPTAEKVSALIRRLQRGDEQARFLAAYRLADLGPKAKAAVPALIAALSDKTGQVRSSAARALGRIGPAATDAIPVLVRLLVKNDDARSDARDALSYIGPAALPVLVQLARESTEPWQCHDAALALGLMGPAAAKAVPALILNLAHENGCIREGAVSGLRGIGAPAVPHLVRALDSKSLDVQQGAAEALGRIQPPARAAIKPLIRVMQKGEVDEVRSVAAAALGGASHGVRDAVPALMKALEDPSGAVRGQAIWGLGNVGPAAKEAVPALIKAGDESLRGAVIALGKIGPAAKDGIPLMIRGLRYRGGPEFRYDTAVAAKHALARIGKAAMPGLVKVLADDDAVTRRMALSALRDIDATGAAARPAVKRLVDDDDPRVRRVAIDLTTPWGRAAKGLQSRVLLLRRKVGPGGQVQAKLQVRNAGKRPVAYDPRGWESFGLWHTHGGDVKPVPEPHEAMSICIASDDLMIDVAKLRNWKPKPEDIYQFPVLAPGATVEFKLRKLGGGWATRVPGTYRLEWGGTTVGTRYDVPWELECFGNWKGPSYEERLKAARKLAVGLPPAPAMTFRVVRAAKVKPWETIVPRLQERIPLGWKIEGIRLRAKDIPGVGEQAGCVSKITVVHRPAPGLKSKNATHLQVYVAEKRFYPNVDRWGDPPEYIGAGKLGHVYVRSLHAVAGRWNHAEHDIARALGVQKLPQKRTGPDWGRAVSRILWRCQRADKRYGEVRTFLDHSALTPRGAKLASIRYSRNAALDARRKVRFVRQDAKRPYYYVDFSVFPSPKGEGQQARRPVGKSIKLNERGTVACFAVKQLGVDIRISLLSDDEPFRRTLAAAIEREVNRVLARAFKAAGARSAIRPAE